MIKKNPSILFLFFIILATNSFSQNFWNTAVKKETSSQQVKPLSRKNTPEKYRLATLNLNGFQNHLTGFKSKRSQHIITLPDSEGKLQRFSIKETSYLAPELAAKFPMIKSYSGQGIDDPTAIAKISLGANGVHALIYSANKSIVYIDPYTVDKKQYIIYKKSALKAKENDFRCQVESTAKKTMTSSIQKRNANDGILRTFRIAIACTNEYSSFHLNRQNIASSATDAVKKAVVLSAINTTMTRVNEVYERDLAVRMVLVNNNDELIFLESNGDDGLTDDNADALIDESQAKCDAIIGDANYDIGHTFSTGGGGLAQVRSVCVTGYKASGITGSPQPINDPYDIDYVCHEIGHQFGGTHTQNNDCNKSSTSVEPGSGSTIMGYAGICSPNVQGNSDPYFHAVSIAQMWAHMQNSGSCATQSSTNNDAPTANAGKNVSIPKGTPFVLEGIATDAQGLNSLTYNWEQIDTQKATMPPVSTSTAGPTFRSLNPTKSPKRYFPIFEDVINGTSNQWIVLPTVARELNFSLTVRDNNAGGGNSARDDMKITVTDAAPFTVTVPNTNVTWITGDQQTISWNKGTTDSAPINCAKVTIKLSVDGGITFPIILKENTPNDGSEEITIPNNITTQARILVEAADNVFYNVNPTNFTINSTDPTFLITNKTAKQTTCKSGTNAVNYTVNFSFLNGLKETVTLSATNLPTGVTASFTPATISSNGDATLMLKNFSNSIAQDYIFNIQGKSASVTQTTQGELQVIQDVLTTVNPIFPIDTDTDTSIAPEFKWTQDDNATAYQIEVATDANFSTIVIDQQANTNAYTSTTSLVGSTTYYWRIKPKNSCAEGTFSKVYKFTTQVPSYCASTFTDEAGGANHISNVTFNSINNNSGNDKVDGYEDFTSKSTTVKRTESHQISVTLNTDGYQDHCYVFIDWNQDFIFNTTDERYDLGTKSGANVSSTYTINIPKNAALGSTRIRVVSEYDDPTNGYGDGACDSSHKEEWGETEDYTLIVTEKPKPDFTLTNTSGNFSICNKATNQQVFTIAYKALVKFNENIVFSVTGLPANATATFSPNPFKENDTVKLTVSNLKNAAIGDYQIVVTATASSIKKSVNIPFNVNNTLCKSAGSMSSQISTTLVRFGSIDNTSTKTTGYTNYTAIDTQVIKGEAYPLVVNANSAGNQTVQTFAWVDWNQNCLFDANEKYDLGTTSNANTATKNSGLKIAIPSDALLGTTILRIVTQKEGSQNSNECQLGFNGEVEDYTIKITPDFTLKSQKPAISICNKAVNKVAYIVDFKSLNDFNENVTFLAENAPENAVVTFNPITINKTGTFTVHIDNLNNAPIGDYTIKVIATAGLLKKSINLTLVVNDRYCKSKGNSTSKISLTNVAFAEINNSSTKTTGYSNFTSVTTPVVRGEQYDLNIEVDSDGNNALKTFGWIDWNQNLIFEESESFNLTTNNTTITIPEDAKLGATILRILTRKETTDKENSCEFNFDGEVEDYTINVDESFATSANLFTDLKIYPVPSYGTLTVNFKVKEKNLTIIKLIDARGQLLETQTFSTISSNFNKEIKFKKVSRGIYFIQIQNDGKLSTRKIMMK